jgi:hypothetical protein
MHNKCPACGNDTYEQVWGRIVACQSCGCRWELEAPVAVKHPNSIGLIGNVSYTEIARKAKRMKFKRNRMLAYPQMKPKKGTDRWE